MKPKDEIDDAIENLDKNDKVEVNYTMRQLKKQKAELDKLISGLHLRRGGIIDEMDSQHFDFKKTVVVRLKNAPLQGFKFALGFWAATILIYFIVKYSGLFQI